MNNKIAEIDELGFRPLEVVVRGDNVDDAIRRFRQLVQADGMLLRLREREGFEKPSDKARRKGREAVRRVHMQDQMEKLMATGEWDKRQEKKEKKRLEKMSKRTSHRVESIII